jgi:hypothetical protein
MESLLVSGKVGQTLVSPPLVVFPGRINEENSLFQHLSALYCLVGERRLWVMQTRSNLSVFQDLGSTTESPTLSNQLGA